MRYLILLLGALMLAGCASRRPLERPPQSQTFEMRDRKLLMDKMEQVLAAENIKIAARDVHAGTMVTDSFEVLPQYCDCGKNLLGAEYPGTRRGVMRLKIGGVEPLKMTIDFKTRLRITANNKEVICTSYGVLEQKLFTTLEKELGVPTTDRHN